MTKEKGDQAEKHFFEGVEKTQSKKRNILKETCDELGIYHVDTNNYKGGIN